MGELTAADTKQIFEEINGEPEKQRRKVSKRRSSIYRDGGKEFLIAHIESEFGRDAVSEMRLAPINILKAIIDKKSVIYKQPPIRSTEEESDQTLVDEYTSRMSIDQHMAKANRYYNLFSNTQLYVTPDKMGAEKEPRLTILPPFLYSVDPDDMNQREMNALVLSNYTTEDAGLTGKETRSDSAITAERASKISGGKVDTDAAEIFGETLYIYWTDTQHFTLAPNGGLIVDERNPEQVNPIGKIPSVNLAKDRDNEYWATQGEDVVDLAIALQLGFTDLLSIAKMQGFSILTVTSEEQPTRMEMGLNKIVWLKTKPDGPTPSIDYVQASSPISEYKELLLDLLGVTLSTNQLSPDSVSGSAGASNITSGFQALIMNADNLQQLEQDKPVLRDAEEGVWQLIKEWHNLLHDKNELPADLRVLGKFTDDFEVSIMYQDMKPIESEEQRLTQIERLMDLGLATKMDGMKKLHPELSDEEIETKLQEIKDEKLANAASFGLPGTLPGDPEEEDEEEEENEEAKDFEVIGDGEES